MGSARAIRTIRSLTRASAPSPNSQVEATLMNEQGCEWRVSTKPNKRPRVYKCLVCGAKSKQLPLPCQRKAIKAALMPDDCPPEIIEVRRNEDGSLDELVAGD